MFGNYFIALIRTAVPGLVGAVIAWLTARGVDVPAGTRDWAVAALTFVFLLIYYAIVHALELKFPQVGVLLGIPKRPVYNGLAPGARPGRHELPAGDAADFVEDDAV